MCIGTLCKNDASAKWLNRRGLCCNASGEFRQLPESDKRETNQAMVCSRIEKSGFGLSSFFAIDPLADVERTLAEFDALGFASSEEANHFPVNEPHFFHVHDHFLRADFDLSF